MAQYEYPFFAFGNRKMCLVSFTEATMQFPAGMIQAPVTQPLAKNRC
jgi:hypothetical protein